MQPLFPCTCVNVIAKNMQAPIRSCEPISRIVPQKKNLRGLACFVMKEGYLILITIKAIAPGING